jgi:hypothetical protein
MKKLIALSLILIGTALLYQTVYAATHPPFVTSYGVSQYAPVEYDGKVYDMWDYDSPHQLREVLAEKHDWYSMSEDIGQLVGLMSVSNPIAFMNGKIYYDWLPEGDPDLPWLLTREEYILEQGIHEYVLGTYGINYTHDPFTDLVISYSDDDGSDGAVIGKIRVNA